MSNAGGFKSLTRYYDMLAGNTVWNPWSPAGAYESIATTTVGTAVSSVTFSGIPATYTHLQIRYIAKNSVTGDSFSMRFNSDTASNYARHELSGFGSTANAYASTSQTSMIIGFEGYGAGSDFGVGIIDILDYTSTSKNKAVRSLTGYDANGGGGVGLVSGLWYKTPEAITSITLNQGNSGNFKEFSQFALYGVKGN